ncbi:MAG: hypothetical protein Q8N63_07350 [Nanoarchaeota archaeon]|nr:hypothetical protein [Nanoarchaeota archaeon]
MAIITQKSLRELRESGVNCDYSLSPNGRDYFLSSTGRSYG